MKVYDFEWEEALKWSLETKRKAERRGIGTERAHNKLSSLGVSHGDRLCRNCDQPIYDLNNFWFCVNCHRHLTGNNTEEAIIYGI